MFRNDIISDQTTGEILVGKDLSSSPKTSKQHMEFVNKFLSNMMAITTGTSTITINGQGTFHFKWQCQ